MYIAGAGDVHVNGEIYLNAIVLVEDNSVTFYQKGITYFLGISRVLVPIKFSTCETFYDIDSVYKDERRSGKACATKKFLELKDLRKKQNEKEKQNDT